MSLFSKLFSKKKQDNSQTGANYILILKGKNGIRTLSLSLENIVSAISRLKEAGVSPDCVFVIASSDDDAAKGRLLLEDNFLGMFSVMTFAAIQDYEKAALFLKRENAVLKKEAEDEKSKAAAALEEANKKIKEVSESSKATIFENLVWDVMSYCAQYDDRILHYERNSKIIYAKKYQASKHWFWIDLKNLSFSYTLGKRSEAHVIAFNEENVPIIKKTVTTLLNKYYGEPAAVCATAKEYTLDSLFEEQSEETRELFNNILAYVIYSFEGADCKNYGGNAYFYLNKRSGSVFSIKAKGGKLKLCYRFQSENPEEQFARILKDVDSFDGITPVIADIMNFYSAHPEAEFVKKAE